MDNVIISSNWISESKISKVLTCSTTSSEGCDIEGLTAETCTCLTKPESSSADLKPEIEIKSKYLIKKLCVFSEGSIIEVFGIHNEYLFTCESDFIDDWEGMAVYHGNIVLPGITNCKLKFTRIKDEKRLWIYNIKLTILKTEEISNQPIFNFQKVNCLINSSSQQISENAEKFKNFLENYLSEDGKKKYVGTNAVFNILQKEYSLDRLCLSKRFSEMLTCSPSSSETGNLGESLYGNKYPVPARLTSDDDYVRKYIDAKMEKIKEDILLHINVRLDEFRKENNEKLDKILKMLETSKSLEEKILDV